MTSSMFRVADLDVKELFLADDRGALLHHAALQRLSGCAPSRIPQLKKMDRAELRDLVAEAWLTRAQKRVAKAWLAEHAEPDD